MTKVATRIHTPGLQKRVLYRVGEKPGETYREIASYLEANRNSVNKTLWRLVKRGDITKTGGQYFMREYDYMDDLVSSANRLSETASTLAAKPRVRRWMCMGLPIYAYGLAALIGYGVGRWL